jgi:hypothetical protein
MQNNKSFTVKYPGLCSVLKVECGVSEAFNPNGGGAHPEAKKYMAIWDTGATGSVITNKVATELGLKPTGVANVSHANGVATVNTYLVNILLPNGIGVIGVRVTEGILHGNTEMLIGKTCFSFRIPSIKTIDFCEEGRTEQSKNSRPTYLNKKSGWKGPKKG